MTDESKKLEAAARQAEGERDWNKAYNLWEKCYSLSPHQVEIAFSVARCATYSGRLERAESMIEALAAGGIQEGQVAMLRADIAELRRDYPDALKWRKAATKLLPGSYWTRFGAARAMVHLPDYPVEKVIAEMEAAMLLPGAESQGGLFTASLLFRNGDFARAYKMADRYLATEDEREVWAINALPGMTSYKERSTARELARTLSGKGKIVDLGCWLGSLSAALASGLKANANIPRSAKVIAYDKFEWVGIYMESVWPGSRFGLVEESDFLPWFRKLTSRWEERIDVRKQDLEIVQWTEGKIEFLVVDAMKTEPLARHIMTTFYPSLLTGAYVFHQDFCHHHTWWIHLLHYAIHHKFRVIDTVDGSGTVVFQLTEPLSGSDIDRALKIDLSDPAFARSAFEYSLSLIKPVDHGEVLKAYMNCEKNFHRHQNVADIEKRLSALVV